MAKLKPFDVDHWIATRCKNAKHLLAQTNSVAASIQDLESIPGDEATRDLLSSIRSRPLDYGTAYNGLTSLRTKIANLYTNSLPHDNVLTTASGSLANFIVLYSLIGQGDHVIAPYPTYPQLISVPQSLGAEVSLWNAKPEANWSFDTEELKALIKPNTKLIIINNPLNPTGTILERATLEEIVRIASKHNITVFDDEIYRPIFYPSSSTMTEIPPSIIELGYKNTVTNCSLSKSYSLAGLRFGWVASNDPEIIAQCVVARSYCLITTSQIDEHIADFTLDKTRVATIVERNVARTARHRDIVQSFINEHSDICSWVTPVGGPIGLIKFTRSGSLVDDLELCKMLHEKKSVLLVPGSMFGVELTGWVRIGLGVDTEPLKEGLGVVSEFIREYYSEVPLAR